MVVEPELHSPSSITAPTRKCGLDPSSLTIVQHLVLHQYKTYISLHFHVCLVIRFLYLFCGDLSGNNVALHRQALVGLTG